MDQIKIGRFIAKCRKSKKLTQVQLAEKLNITDRAVSKWETGRAMPDSSIMLDLCKELGISVNELLSGEVIDMKDYDKKTEEILLELTKQDEEKNKKLIAAMYAVGIISTLFYLGIVFLASYAFAEGSKSGLIIIAATIIYIAAIFVTGKFETDAGYYECKNCHYRFKPSYKEVVMSTHIATTRRLKCPKCQKRSWAKKVMSKE